MPVHDWKRVSAGTFHHFHYMWIAECVKVLSEGLLPTGYYAFADQITGQIGPDVLTLERHNGVGQPFGEHSQGMIAVSEAPPKVSQTMVADVEDFARKSREIAIRHESDDRLVAIIEIVSQGNKSSRHALRKFLDKAIGSLYQGIHLLVVDLQPPTNRDPLGIHAAIWSEIKPEEELTPPEKPYTLVSYSADSAITAYVEPVAVGDVLPDMPLFLEPEFYIKMPLEMTYLATWRLMPPHVKEKLEQKSELRQT